MFIKVSLLVLAVTWGSACSEAKNNPQNAEAVGANAAPVTVSGVVRAVAFGKDGYTAEVQTENDGMYAALVSIVNVGGREKYKSCEAGDKVTFKGILAIVAGIKQLKVTEIVGIASGQTRLVIAPHSFRGIQVGDLIAKHKEYTQKTKLRTGEGAFVVYEIKDFDNNPAGYLLPDPNNQLLVGDIIVQTPKAQTAKGVKTGDTFQDLLKIFPDIQVHGSETEGRTYATANNLSYRLDVANFSYEIDKTKIPGTAKITEIRINRAE